MFILVTLVNWRFSKQRMKRDASLNTSATYRRWEQIYANIFRSE